MSAKLITTATGAIIHSEGDIDAIYGIASLSKIWAAVLLYDRIKIIAAQQNISIDTLLEQKITVAFEYEPMIYHRMEVRPDLLPPDDPLTYQPFRKEKHHFRLPIEKDKSYSVRKLIEASLFQSKNDAIQALTDHFFANDDNMSFRAASASLADKFGLQKTKIFDPHGLCDGDNVSTARELAKFGAAIIQNNYLNFFSRFDYTDKGHTARKLLDDERLKRGNIQILLAKTATGNNRQGNDSAESLMVIAKIDNQLRIAITLSDEDKFRGVTELLLETDSA